MTATRSLPRWVGLTLVVVCLAAGLPWPALSAQSAPARQAVILTPGQATGAEIVALDGGRTAAALPAPSNPSSSYRWQLPEPLAPGWWEVTVEFAKRPKDSPRIKFFFGPCVARVFDLNDADNAWNLDRFRLRLWCATPLASLEVRPQRRMPEAIRAITRVAFEPVGGPALPTEGNASDAPRLLGLLVETSSNALPAGLPAGNWQIAPVFRFPTAARGALTGALTLADAQGGRISAPMAQRMNVYLQAAPIELTWEAPAASTGGAEGAIDVTAVKGAVLQFVPPYRPRLPLDRQNAPLPIASANQRTRVTLAFATDSSVSDINGQPPLPLLPGNARVAVVTSWDDGAANDQRCAAALEKHGYRGTFFLMQNKAGDAAFLSDLERRGMEIASHTVNHPRGWAIAPEQWAAECLQMRLRLEAALGHPVISFAYPYNYNPAYDTRGDYVLRGVREAGYLSGRTTRNGEETVTGYAEPLALVTDSHFLGSAERLEKAWQRASSRPGGVFYFWGHSYEIRTEADWSRFDAFLARYAHQPGAWYATQGQLFLWRWLRENVEIVDVVERDGSIRMTLAWPKLDPWLARQMPLTLQVPPDVSEATVETDGASAASRTLPAGNGLVTVPADWL